MKKPIVFDQVRFSYDAEVPVLKNISITFSTGSIAIIGENGAGKTTLMKLMNGLLKPSEGYILVGDLNTREQKTSTLAKHVGIVFQNPDDQIFKSKVIDEIMFGPLNIGMPEEKAREYARRAIVEMDLVGLEEENPFDLSYSIRKRIGMASILAMDTDIVIFDEPTIGQDVEGLRRIGKTIQRLEKEGKMVIAIVHDMNFVYDYFSRVIVMAQGEIIAEGSPEEVFIREDILKQARVAAPSLVQLLAALELPRTIRTIADFTDLYHEMYVRGQGQSRET